ncbi:PorT family protein [Mucilaginibacter sp. UR6-1]|uniref:porin family protein n=1 Tax=Mucilaginibacter sp. UR6-1 TaxID=1435643 RepID=UPI001E2BC31B|nr:porin family protein [Mucilaginibacter sp. UR6-1]MCC8409686.1 PorT family protein [Mucilaginibacter sp. UR6-1]
MKKYFLSVAMLVACFISAKAQVTVGAKAGVTFSKINTDELKESSVAGYQVGGFARIGSNWFLQPELYLGSSGGKFESDDNTYSGKVRFTTLNIPVLIGKSFGQEDLNLHLVAGPVYSAILSDSRSFGDNVNEAFRNYKSSTLGFQAGGGVDVGNITVDLRYEGGLSKVSNYFDQRQSLWALSVGYKFF